MAWNLLYEIIRSRVLFRHTIKIAFRNLIRHKGYTLINVSGLAIGMTCCMLIFLWVRHELSYDRFHTKADRIYRVYQEKHHQGGIMHFSNIPLPLAPELQSSVPEISAAARLIGFGSTVRYQGKSFHERFLLYGDPAVFQIFSFSFRRGEARSAFSDPNSIVITDTMAQKYFGEEDPMGKVLVIDGTDQLRVTGVLDNIPENSSLRLDFIVPMAFLEASGFDITRWDSSMCQTYILLHPLVAFREVEAKISGLLQAHVSDSDEILRLQPLKRIHLYTLYGEPGAKKYVFIFSLIAAFILTIASINFTNLATARSFRRAREVSLRKVVGAQRWQVARQFFGESLFMALLALGLSLLLVELSLPAFSRLAGKTLSLNLFGDGVLYAGLLLIGLVTGLLSGSYPAVFLSSFRPAVVLKGISRLPGGGTRLRKVLVVFQFSLSIMLIISTLVIDSQLQYLQEKDLGFDRENLVYIEMGPRIGENFDAVKSELISHPGIRNITRTFQVPSYNRLSAPAEWSGKTPDQDIIFHVSIVDYDYIETLGLELVEGRNFSRDFSTDTRNFILNQEAVRKTGLRYPVGHDFGVWEEGQIIGVVKDYNFMPLSFTIEPLVLALRSDLYRYAMVQMEGPDLPGAINHMEATWQSFDPDFPFEYHFLNDDFDLIYRSETRMGKLVRYFTVLAIFISCLGLLGLTSFMTEQRTREIGIRKLLGASVSGIVTLLLRDFSRWVLLANLVAWPAAYYAMWSWLQAYAYQVAIGVAGFVLAAVLALLLAVFTVGFQALKAAIADPVKALHYE
jgi:ABC-type antimicrobial peptide transport system permease subunit